MIDYTSYFDLQWKIKFTAQWSLFTSIVTRFLIHWINPSFPPTPQKNVILDGNLNYMKKHAAVSNIVTLTRGVMVFLYSPTIFRAIW